MEVYCYFLLFLSSYSALAAADANKYNWTKYQDVFDIYNYMEKLKEDHPQSVNIVEIGKTYGKAPIRVLEIEDGDDYYKKPVVIAAGLSASAWLSISTATYIMNELLNSKEKHIRYIRKRYHWIIAPVLNPDGYDYTWLSSDRQWDNNRQPYGKCFGADLNKNFNLNWQYSQRDSNSCIGQFNGFYPHSEVETRSWVDYIRTFQTPTLLAYFELLNFGQTIRFLNDYAYSASTREQWRLIAGNAAKVAADRYGTVYSNLCSVSNINKDRGYYESNLVQKLRVECCSNEKNPLRPKSVLMNLYRHFVNKQDSHVRKDYLVDSFRVNITLPKALDDQGSGISWVTKNFDVWLPIAIEHRGSGPDQPPEQILPNAQEIFDSVVSMILQREPPTTDFDNDNN